MPKPQIDFALAIRGDDYEALQNEWYEIAKKYWSQLLSMRVDVIDRDLGSIYRDPEPTPPQRPITLIRILQEYALDLFDSGSHHYYPVEELLTRQNIARLVEREIASSISKIEGGPNGGRLTYHASLEFILAQVRELLAARALDWKPPSKTADSTPMERSNEEMITSFISKVQRHAKAKVPKTAIWAVAGYKDRTQFERFQRGERVTVRAMLAFNSVLAMDCERFLGAWRKISASRKLPTTKKRE